MRRPRFSQMLLPAGASAEEAAAVVVALERFVRATAPAPDRGVVADRWRRAAMLEGVTREDEADLPHPWINT